MLLSVLLLTAAAAAAPGPPPLTVDLDGDGKPETVRAAAKGSSIRVDVANAAGKRAAGVNAAGPGGSAEVALSAGTLGDAGSILEVAAAGAGRECRTFWRLRGGKLESLPLVGPKGRVPDCAPAEGWTDRWSRPTNDAPADYVRERTRATPRGDFRRMEFFRFAGFELRYEAGRSRAEIAGVAIPDIAPIALYPKALVDSLLSCFDLSGFKTAARLRIAADPDAGVFDAVLEDRSGERRLPITEARNGNDRGLLLWTAGSGEEAAHLRVRLGTDERLPVEIATEGHGREWNLLYTAAARVTGRGLEVFASAEDELATWSLPGGWDSRRASRIQVTPLSASPAVVEFDKQKVAVSISDAPAGADVLLVPRDGSPPRMALRLRGPNLFTRLPVECPAGTATCKVREPGDEFRRLGTAMNVR